MVAQDSRLAGQTGTRPPWPRPYRQQQEVGLRGFIIFYNHWQFTPLLSWITNIDKNQISSLFSLQTWKLGEKENTFKSNIAEINPQYTVIKLDQYQEKADTAVHTGNISIGEKLWKLDYSSLLSPVVTCTENLLNWSVSWNGQSIVTD